MNNSNLHSNDSRDSFECNEQNRLPWLFAKRITVAGNGGSHLVPCREPLTTRNNLRFGRGLPLIVSTWAQIQGYTEQLRLTCPPIANLDDPSGGSPRLDDPKLPAFVQSHVSGLIRIGTGVQLVRIIKQIADAFPAATLAIIAESRTAVGSLRGGLQQLAVDLGRTTPNAVGDAVPRIVVGTSTDMADDHIELNKRQIVIFADALEALGQRAQLMLTSPDPRFRLFGILPAKEAVSPYELDWLLATFGPAEVVIPRHGYELVPTSVAWMRVGGPVVDRRLTATRLRRKGYWRNPMRNRRIGKLAQAIVGHRLDSVAALVPHAPQQLAVHRNHRVMVLVDAVEHALNLARYLPGWPIETANEVGTFGLDPRRLASLREPQRAWSSIPGVLATVGSLQQDDTRVADVVIWAGGGSGLPPLRPKDLICRAGENRRLLIIDIDDKQAPQLRKWSRRRREKYLANDVYPVGIDTTQGRIAQFLADHPEAFA